MVEERPDLGRAPAWARHLHDCMHEMKLEQQRDRHTAANRDMVLDATLGTILDRLGKESDDGKSGTGLIGEIRRTGSTVASLSAERNMMRGALAAITAAGVLILAGVKAWVQSLVAPGS